LWDDGPEDRHEMGNRADNARRDPLPKVFYALNGESQKSESTREVQAMRAWCPVRVDSALPTHDIGAWRGMTEAKRRELLRADASCQRRVRLELPIGARQPTPDRAIDRWEIVIGPLGGDVVHMPDEAALRR